MRKTIILAFIVLILIGSVLAADLSTQLKRTNPGIAGTKPAELIFDVVNIDTEHKTTAFLLCRSPDDAVVSSSLGAAAGSGAQYISERFTMDTAPFQKSITLTVNSDTPGDRRTGCIIKYIPFKETTKTEDNKTMTTKQYLKLNGDYISETELKDDYYRELRLDKTVPFVKGMSDPKCPEGQATCTANDIIDLGAGGSIPTWAIVVGVVIIVLLVAYLLGRTSRT